MHPFRTASNSAKKLRHRRLSGGTPANPAKDGAIMAAAQQNDQVDNPFQGNISGGDMAPRRLDKFARGGAVKNSSYINGLSTPENLSKWAGYARRNTFYKRGGAVRDESTQGGYEHKVRGEDPQKLEKINNLKPEVRPEAKMHNADGYWAKKQGGSGKTAKPAQMMKEKFAGQGGGMGLKEYAKHMRKSYP